MKEIKPYIRKTQFYETDGMGIIHHSNYIRWFEEARVDFMEQMGYGYDKTVEEGVDFGVLGVSCDYKSMVRFGDYVEIRIRLTSIEAMRMTVSYEVIDKKTGALCTTGDSRHFYYDREKGRPVSLKKRLPDLYEQFQEYAEQ